MKKFIFLLAFLFSYFSSYSQNLDSLLQVARTTKNDSLKFSAFNRVGFNYIFNDTKKASEIINEGKQLAIEKSYPYGIAALTNTYGIFMDVTGQSDSAKYYFTEALKISRKFNITSIESRCVNNLGMYNWNRGNYNEALKYFFESLKMVEKTNDRKAVSIRLNNIGLIYQDMNLADKALDYHNRALQIRKEFNLKKDQVASLNNIGICYKELGRIDDAIRTYEEGIKLAKESNNLLDYYSLLDNLANTFQIKKDYGKAIETHLKALDKPDNYKVDPGSDLTTYANLSALYNKIDNPQRGIHFAKKGFEILNQNPHLENLMDELYLNMAESNYMLDNFKKAREYRNKYISLKDSIFSENNAKAFADLEVKYETEKKEKEILVQRAEIAEQDLTIQQRNFQIYGLIGLALLLGILGYLFFNQQKLKNNQLKKENELKVALSKIETQNRLQEQRLRISRDLHDNIGAQLTFIISSLDSLKYNFDLPDKLNSKLDDIGEFTSTTIFELRDTIWAMNKSSISFEDLQSRISNFIEKADLSSKDMDFKFNVNVPQLNEVNFSSIQGINIYRIIQEAVNNAVKYSKASKIEVIIRSIDKAILINIKDNGIGFNKNEVDFGNGLNNIEKRALELNASATINSEKNKGTQIVLSLPIES